MDMRITTPYDEELEDIEEFNNWMQAREMLKHNKSYLNKNVDSACPNIKKLVLPGEAVLSKEDKGRFLKGSGLYEENENFYACILGTVNYINKLVYVEPLRGKYTGAVGDLLVGKIKDINNDKWVVEIGSYCRALLSISQTNISLFSQRIRLYNDVINMINIYKPNDIIACEVQRILNDGCIILHTRSSIYGKLTNGVLITVPQTLIQNQKKHIFVFSCNVQIILGMNGYIWISSPLKKSKDTNPNSIDEDIEGNKFEEVDDNTRKNISIISNIIKLLAKYHININYDIITKIYMQYTTNKNNTTSYILKPYVSDSYLFNYIDKFIK
ncbi:exosome complex component RRP4 [Plasmodium brasilianum]|uniref:Exosome complex component RRP4, putative n=2 Tax=Plasmodium (Plasmodium) TaxID=418103 RepID=A0A1A8X3C4_PLAMA|nr:exosome complex component RRP4, putative [Plasmodium malariae]KAI4840684.1 exosome complex component RRP4 [Plasmodium brasilianum]SBS99726.1 exosome complex component RRP4, putative (RRP4) [Plasmodium malariae]SBT70388.1 exosome complex component RRP4, putative [Plasmodium malariae]SBT86250.1 exosome complex component RRP4, putative [Plasmodium malariae]